MYATSRICRYCGKTFSPEHSRQVYCTPACREKDKNRQKRLKTKAKHANVSIEDARAILSGKTHLSISEAAQFLGVSRPTIYARIKEGEITPLRVSSRTVRIPIDQLQVDTSMTPQPSKGDFSVLISKEEALERYNIKAAWLYRKLKAEGIRAKIIKGKAYLPKKDLDRMFPPKPTYNPAEWYNADDIIKSEGLTRKHISEIVRNKKLTHRREGRILLISKKEWDSARLLRGDIEKNYLTVDQAKKHYHLGQQTFYDKVKAAGIEGVRTGVFVYYKISDLDRLFKDKAPKIPAEIKRNYMRGGDALKHYHLGQKRFLEETQAAGVTKIRTEGKYVWYKKDELDKLFKKITDDGSN